jgi:hypothetical protein
MGIIKNVGNGVWEDMRLNPKEAEKLNQSSYAPSDEERAVRAMIIRHFTLGYQTMYKPRTEFNDLSVIGRMTIDQMSFNTYQPNNGDPAEGDLLNGWRSNAVRPIVRNKCISIAAHATARLIFPKIFACNESSDAQEEAAKVMSDLMEWSADQSNYSYSSLQAILAAIVNPASFIFTEYGEVFRNVKKERGADGKWKVEKMLSEDDSGFKDVIVPVDELYIENIYEHDIQKQGWLIWRRVISYTSAQTKYQDLPNWKYIKPGVQVLYNDANQTFYESYDSNMRTEEVEEIIYFNKNMDVKLVLVNGVMLTEYDNPNPRLDKQYPFIKFGYELVDEGKFFYYKSLAFKMQQDANIVNTLYPMIIDGTYLSVFPAMYNVGSESIGSDVIIPGAVTNLTDPNSKLNAIPVSTQLQTGMNTLLEVNKSIDETASDPLDQSVSGGTQTAYEISRLEQNAATVLGLFLRMIGQYVKQYGKLRVSDILQHLTVVDVDKITDESELVYKTFLVQGKGKHNLKKIVMKGDMSDEPISDKEHMDNSYKLLAEQDRTNQEIIHVNPRLFRDLKYSTIISPDVLQPKSEDLDRAYKLELYDRAIQLGPLVDQEKVAKDFLFKAYKEVRDPDEYFKVASPNNATATAQMPNNGQQAPQPQGAMQAMKGALPNVPSTGAAM